MSSGFHEDFQPGRIQSIGMGFNEPQTHDAWTAMKETIESGDEQNVFERRPMYRPI